MTQINFSSDDLYFMDIALRYAKRGLGMTSPNPSVGCVIVQQGQIVAVSHTAKGGRPHAEILALEAAGPRAKGATLYVTLEPCCHVGQTPPCTEALAATGLSRIVIATKDPDVRVSGNGIKQLEALHINVTYGVREEEAKQVNAGFFSVIERGRPFITLKTATSLDGKIATMSGESKWITGGQSRHYAHLLRAEHDAVLVGIGTAMADDPTLTCRLAGMEGRSPVRVVADSQLRLPLDSALVQTASTTPLWIIARQETVEREQEKLALYRAKGVRILSVETVDIKEMVALLAREGITRLLVEGGGKIAASFIRANSVDALVWFKAPLVLGADAISAVGALQYSFLAEASRWQRVECKAMGKDMLEIYQPLPSL